MIKAIETVYNGYRFRSRLEARWAVFFDTLGIPYEYEKEGFDLDGTWYLPDFWLPERDCWIEIKGNKPTLDEMKKAELLAFHTDKSVYLFWGEVGVPTDSMINGGCKVDPSNSWHKDEAWCQCIFCGEFSIAYMGSMLFLSSCECIKKKGEELLDKLFYWLFSVSGASIQFQEEMKYSIEPEKPDEPRTPELFFWWKRKNFEVTRTYNTPRLIAAYTAARQARFEHRS